MPPHSPNMYREPPATTTTSPSVLRHQQQQQLVGSPSLYRNINAPAAAVPSSPAWAGSPRFQTSAAPPGSPASGQSSFVDGQFKPGSPLLRSPPPVIPQTLQLVQQSPQVQLRRQNTSSPDSPQQPRGQDSPALRPANGQSTQSSNKIKCVFIGDGAVGKTSLIISYTTNGYPNEYVPTAMDTYHAVVHVDEQPLTLELCDTPGQDDFDSLRPLVYPNTDVFLLCFSVVIPSSFHNVRERWIPEVRAFCGKVPVLLVGTQSDLREDAKTLVQLRKYKEQPVQEAEARKLAQSLGCELYVECSSLTQKNLKDVFDSAIVEGLASRTRRERKLAKKAKKKHCTLL